MRRPDFETWWRYVLGGAETLEVNPSTLQISRAWRHRNKYECKAMLGHDIVSARTYFKYCKEKIKQFNIK